MYVNRCTSKLTISTTLNYHLYVEKYNIRVRVSISNAWKCPYIIWIMFCLFLEVLKGNLFTPSYIFRSIITHKYIWHSLFDVWGCCKMFQTLISFLFLFWVDIRPAVAQPGGRGGAWGLAPPPLELYWTLEFNFYSVNNWNHILHSLILA